MGLDSMLFGIVMTAAVAAILFNHGGVYVLGGALAIALWQLAEIVGPSPLFAAYIAFVAAAVFIASEMADADWFELSPFAIRVLDAVLTRWSGGGRDDPEIWDDQDDD